ncbi:thiol-disulfide oxidoreductase DCC family protein [Paenibacillus sp. P26]|nr:thiol-disulfide oxidoreductase DCC family protein [Paenibacillus sp. P26]
MFYDGVCGFCSRVVQFIIPRDPEGRFHFAAIQSAAGQRMLAEQGLDPKALDTFVLLERNRVYTRSTAALRVVRGLRGAWPFFYVFIMVPRPVRDAVYNFIARNRYRWFGRSESCMPPAGSVRNRFLED